MSKYSHTWKRLLTSPLSFCLCFSPLQFGFQAGELIPSTYMFCFVGRTAGCDVSAFFEEGRQGQRQCSVTQVSIGDIWLGLVGYFRKSRGTAEVRVKVLGIYTRVKESKGWCL